MNPFKLSCADFTFPLLSLDKALKLIALLEFDGVDVGIFNPRGHVQPADVLEDPAFAGQRLRTRVEDVGLVISDVFLQGGAGHGTREINHPLAAVRAAARENFKHAVEFAVSCNVHHLTGLPGVSFMIDDPRACWQRAVEEASWRAVEARKAGLTYAVEPHVGSICGSTELALRFVEDGEGLSLTLDYGHFVSTGESVTSVHRLIPYASHLHARGAARGHLQTRVATSDIDFGVLPNELKRRGYRGWVCIEYIWTEWEKCNQTDNVSETITLRNKFQINTRIHRT